jgi:hypothetical protein
MTKSIAVELVHSILGVAIITCGIWFLIHILAAFQ